MIARLELNKQVQQLEKYLNSPSRDEERHRSHYMASTTATKNERTPECTFRMNQFDTQSSIPYDAQSFVKSGNGYDIGSNFIEREIYTPKIAKVNYIEGSHDDKWSSRDFPWTRKLEVQFLFYDLVLFLGIILSIL